MTATRRKRMTMFEIEDDELFGQFEMGFEVGKEGIGYEQIKDSALPGSASEKYLLSGWRFGCWKRRKDFRDV
ncbi:MAG TPA: hypothetical protein VOA88_01110 [Candidatus Dormibacteraeota bacterium]|nr:hypothetical protein [Candidatus Dormibacteraeota bacterium]